MTVVVRRVRDLDELARAFDLAGGVQEPPMTHDDWRFDAVRDGFAGARDVCLLAEVEGVPVGAALSFRDEGGVRVRLLGVLPQHRGSGVGRRLMEEIVDAGVRAADDRAYLGSVPSAVGFYESVGFRRCGSALGDVTVMERRGAGMTQRASSFGPVAEAYERYRLGYPDTVVEAVQRYADRPLRTALELGAGTGKATRAFAGHGIDVTATEPDPGMLAVLRREVPQVRTVESTLEGLTPEVAPDAAYDLVLVAAALHWTVAEGRWERIARLLPPGGVFTSFGGHPMIEDEALRLEVARLEARTVGDGRITGLDDDATDDGMTWPGNELRAGTLFHDVEQVDIPRRLTMDAADLCGFLGTASIYLVADPAVRDETLSRVRSLLPDQVPVVADIRMHLARRVG